MSNPQWVKSSGSGAPYNSMPPPTPQTYQMPQHQVPQQHPTQQQLHQQQQYQNMSWNTIPPKEASMDSWDSWQAQPQSHPTTASTTQHYPAHSYGQQPQHQPAQQQSTDHWNWGLEETPQVPQQQPVLNNNINQSFQNDSAWNWNADQTAASQNPANYYQVGYGSQTAYCAPSIDAPSQLPANNNQAYSEADIGQTTPHTFQDMSNISEFGDHIKIGNEEEIKTEQTIEAPERYEDHLEPAMSDVSKNSMTPQWSIESQVSQDSDDVSSSIGQVGGHSPVSGSHSKSEDIDQRLYGYGSSGDNQNLWDDTEDDEEVNNSNPYPEQLNDSNKSAPLMNQKYSQSNLDETVAALESLNMTADNSDVLASDALTVQPLSEGSNMSSEPPFSTIGPPPSSGLNLVSSGPHPSIGPTLGLPPVSSGPPSGLPPVSSGPPSGLPPVSSGPPSGLPPPTNIGMSPLGSNPYSVSRGGLTHKSATKLFSNSGNTRPVYATPPQLHRGLENSQINQESFPISRLPDNHELSDTVENRSNEPPAGQETGNPTASASQVPSSWGMQDNLDFAPRFGLDRNQYLETGQLTSQTSEEENVPPPGLHRLVTGQLTEQDSVVEVATPPPGLDRMIPGQITEGAGLRMVPGRMTDDDDDDDDDNHNDLPGASRNASRDQNIELSSNLRRMVPGQTDSQEEEDELPNISSGPSDLPPGLHRMVPGESSSPESQANNVGGMQSSQMNSAFQPIEPREPRVVTGDSMESMPQPVVAPSPQQSIKVEALSPSPDTILESRGPANVQPTSERSETIGSDGVDDKAADNATKRSDRRSRDDADNETQDDREPRGRDFYRRDRDDDMDRSMSPSDSGSNRYRDDRDWNGERDRDRRYDSPEGRPRYRDRRTREKEGDYDPDRRYDARRDPRSKREGDKLRRGFNREEGDPESDGYSSEHDGRKWNRDRDPDRDVDRDRNKEGDRDRERDRDRDRDRYRDRYRDVPRDRDRDRDRDDYYRRVDRRGQDTDKARRSGRRSDDYHRSYDDDPYYRERRSSRPSSRSGSVHEYGHGYERDYRDERHDRPVDRQAKHSQYYSGAGYYYNPQDYYRYQMYYANLRKTDPEAYAAWYRKYYSQYAASQPGTYEDRGSVHSGRSSANEELSNQRFDRHRSPNRSQSYYPKSPQTSSSVRYQSTDNVSPFSRESGRGVGHGESSLDETNSSIQRLTPFKFSTAHIKGILTRGGHLLKILPHYPLDGQSATVEMYSLQSMVPQDANIHELLSLPGPLVRQVTHKKTIISYLRSKMESTRTDPSVYDRQSVILLYELLILLLRQNGMIVGTDIAELLLRNGDNSDPDDSWSASVGVDHRGQSTPSPAPSGGSRTSSASATQAMQMGNSISSLQAKLSELEITNKFREFLLYGSTKEALEWAMKHGLWGHALFLSSKLDQRMYHSVMTRFANGLALTDPIQTLYQLLSGWQPAAVTCVADDKWGDWRPHLAMILSNTSSRPEIDHKAIMTLGDTLAARGCLHASHFCYLMAQHPFGTYAQRSSKYVLLGSSHLRPFSEFATSEAIMITSIYEYARSLADASFHIPNLQSYKYLMATRLVEANLLPEAVHYCEIISRLIVQSPQQYDQGFIHDVTELGESLKFHDPFYSTGGDLNLQGDPDWLLQIRSASSDSNNAILHSNISNYDESYLNSTYNAIQNDTSHEQTTGSTHTLDPALYGHEMSHQHIPTEQPPEQQLQQLPQQQQMQQQQMQQQQMQQIQPQTQSEQLQQQQFYYPDQQAWGHQEGQIQQATDLSSYNTDGYGQAEADQSGWWSSQQEDVSSISTETNTPVTSVQNNLEPIQQQQSEPVKPTLPSPTTKSSSPLSPPSSSASAKTANRQPSGSSSTQSNSSWFGGLWNKIALRPKNQMKLPDDKNPSIVWDDKKKRWINADADGEEESSILAPPPKMSEMSGRFASPGPASSTPNPSVGSTIVANGNVSMPFSTPVTSAAQPIDEGDGAAAKPPAGPNMFKLPRGRSLRASYVDVMNPGGPKPPAATSIPPSNLFPTSVSQPSSLNYFVPAAVEGIENAPTDFLTPSPAVAAPVDGSSEQQPLSRWSSTSSLSREVQSYTTRRPPSRNQVQVGSAGPQMFNPAQFSQQPMTTTAVTRKRYAN